jgi:hypothetical protein
MFLVFNFKNEDVVAVSRNISSYLLDAFPRTTFKKKLFFIYLKLSIKFNGLFPLVNVSRNILLFDSYTYVQLFDFIKKKINLEIVSLLVVRNLNLNRKRVYIWGQTKQDDMVFIKIGKGNNNFQLFSNEAIALRFLEKTKCKFNFPKLIGFYEGNNVSILITSFMNVKKNTIFLANESSVSLLLNELNLHSLRKLDFTLFCNSEWFVKFQHQICPNSYQHLKKILSGRDIDVCFVHGDLGSENLCYSSGVFGVVDWERSTFCGPIATDYLGYWLGFNSRSRLYKTKFEKLFFDTFVCSKTEMKFTTIEILLAICFLKTMEYPPAEFIFSRWESRGFNIE